MVLIFLCALCVFAVIVFLDLLRSIRERTVNQLLGNTKVMFWLEQLRELIGRNFRNNFLVLAGFRAVRAIIGIDFRTQMSLVLVFLP